MYNGYTEPQWKIDERKAKIALVAEQLALEATLTRIAVEQGKHRVFALEIGERAEEEVQTN